MSRQINQIIIHCSANGPTSKMRGADIKRYHMKERGWDRIGYHYVIPRDGSVEATLDENVAGIHCSGHNARSIGICLVGGIQDGRGGDANKDGLIEDWENKKKGAPEANYVPEQWAALKDLVKRLMAKYPHATVHGHNEFAKKACPCFDVQKWLKEL